MTVLSNCSLLMALLMFLSGCKYSSQRLWFPEENELLTRPKHQPSDHQDWHGVLVGFRAPFLKHGRSWNGQHSNATADSNSSVSKRAPVKKLVYMMSPMSDQLLDVDLNGIGADLLGLADRYRAEDPQMSPSSQFDMDCRTLRSSMLLTKEEVDSVTGRPVRNCRGLVQVNRCEGSCSSTVQPSIKSHVGLKKDCFCCNEGSFRRVEVRLNECYLVSANDRRIEEDEVGSYMDTSVEEPAECKCRRCDGTI